MGRRSEIQELSGLAESIEPVRQIAEKSGRAVLPAIADLLVTGSVFEDHSDGWPRSIEEFMPVTADRSGDERMRFKGR